MHGSFLCLILRSDSGHTLPGGASRRAISCAYRVTTAVADRARPEPPPFYAQASGIGPWRDRPLLLGTIFDGCNVCSMYAFDTLRVL